MRITKVDTIACDSFSNIVWVQIHTDEGIVGTGETFRNPRATIEHVHETCAPHLIGKNPHRIEQLSYELNNVVGSFFRGFPTRSIETRAVSAIDIALWNIKARSLGVPLYELFGGCVTDSVRVYNTCANAMYNAVSRTAGETILVQPSQGNGAPSRQIMDDLKAQYDCPGELALSLLEDGITALKIWPFDVFARKNEGREISLEDLRKGVSVIEEIRKTVGDRIDVLLEFHGLWLAEPARKIAHALRDLDIYWSEEPVAMHRFGDLARYAQSTQIPICGSETMGTKEWYREAFKAECIDVANFDIAWVGGLSEARKIAALAESFGRTIAPHDCTGPIVLAANAHLAFSQKNTLIAEIVRSHFNGFYRDIVTDLPTISDGWMQAPTGDGIGCALQPEFLARDDVVVRSTTL
ncbi:MAG: mandelate racemase/muconate lactonizing enzyme family protein [Rhodospirillales bacterium]|jgi:galactonate dehydratase|nr:mandelate racemase/muconate lactonizing enzyme family protein [Rhodospirillales bacterium]